MLTHTCCLGDAGSNTGQHKVLSESQLLVGHGASYSGVSLLWGEMLSLTHCLMGFVLNILLGLKRKYLSIHVWGISCEIRQDISQRAFCVEKW